MQATIGRLAQAHYGIAVMVELGRRPGAPVALSALAAATVITLSHAEDLGAKLSRCGVVKSVLAGDKVLRLGRRPSEISLLSIVLAVEERRVHQARKRNRASGGAEQVKSQIDAIQDVFLKHISLADLVGGLGHHRELPEALGKLALLTSGATASD